MDFWATYFLAFSITMVAWILNNRRLLDWVECIPVVIIALIPWLNFIAAICQCITLAVDEWMYREFRKEKK